MTSLVKIFEKFGAVFYFIIPMVTIAALYSVLYGLDGTPLSYDLSVSSSLSSSDPLSYSTFPSLNHLCKETDWTAGLWLQCHSNVGTTKTAMNGGLSNLRNKMQTCVRLAISAGAGVIIPTFATRSDSDLMEYQTEECPDALFDTASYQQDLFEACPQLHIRSCNDTAGLDITIEAKFRSYQEPSHSGGSFRALIDDTIAKSGVITRPEISWMKPVRILYGDPYVGWNYVAAAEMEVKKDLFRTLRYNTTLSEIGQQVFDTLKQAVTGPIVAVHLRGEVDWPDGFGGLDVQIDLYTKTLLELRDSTLDANGTATIRDVYVSCGNPEAIRTFQKTLEPLGYVVHDKLTLLANHTDILEKIEALRFDARAITEYDSLVSADYYLGLLSSSLSDSVAYARTVGEKDDYFSKYIRPGSKRLTSVDRTYPDPPSVRGNEHTKLIVLTGPDIMDCFP